MLKCVSCCLTKKAEPPPTRDVNRDSGTDSANGGWLRRLVRHHVNLLLNRHVLNSSMLQPSHTPTRAATGGFSAPNDENQTKNAMQPTQSNRRIIKPAKLLGLVARKPNKAEIITNASPVKKDQRPPMD